MDPTRRTAAYALLIADGAWHAEHANGMTSGYGSDWRALEFTDNAIAVDLDAIADEQRAAAKIVLPLPSPRMAPGTVKRAGRIVPWEPDYTPPIHDDWDRGHTPSPLGNAEPCLGLVALDVWAAIAARLGARVFDPATGRPGLAAYPAGGLSAAA